MAKGGQIRYQVGFDIQKQNLEQLKSSLQQLQNFSLNDLMKINNTTYNEARNIFNGIRDEAQNVEKALQQAFNPKLGTVNIETFNQSLLKSGSSIQNVYNTFKKAGTTGENAFRNLTTAALNTNIQLRETHTILDKMAETFANTIKWNIASTAINGVSRAVQQAWGYAQSLDSSLNDIRIVTGKSADEMADFAVKANNAAKTLGQTTTDYTNAALIYAQQGLSDKEVEERAKITLKAANVTGQSTSDVSEQLTAVWNGYKVTAEQAELYVDRLAAVAATTASDLEELSTGMSKVASAAAAMGVSEEQLAAQLSTIISATRQAPESVGTALRTVYARISDIKAGIDEDGVTLGNYSGKMEALGFSVLDVNGNLRDMGEVMEEIGGRWQNLTREQQVNLAQTMAGQRQYNNLLALFDNFEKYNESLNVAQNAAGTLQKQQDTYMESTAAHLKTLKASVEDVYDSLIDTKSINPLIDALSKLTQLVAQFIDSLGGGGAVLRAIGSIGLTVFSEHIAKGLNTTIYNLQVGKENARQFEQQLEAAKNWQGIPELDETTKQLLKNREELSKLAQFLTPEQFTFMQKLLIDVKDNGNATKELTGQFQALQKVINLVSDQKLNDILGTDAMDDVVDQIEKITDNLKNIPDLINKSQEKLNTIRITKPKNEDDVGHIWNTKKDQQAFESIQQNVANYFKQLDKLNQQDFLNGHEAEIEKLKTTWQSLVTEGLNNNTKPKFEKFFSDLQEIFAKGNENLKPELEKLYAEINGAELSQAIKKSSQQTETAVNKLVSSLERMSRAVDINKVAKVAGGLSQIGNSIRQIQNLGSIWAKSDLTTGQRLLQTVTNLGTSLPMLINGFKQLQTVMNLSKAVTGVLGGITAIITVIGLVTNAMQENQKAIIDANNKIIESENKKQEEIAKDKELIASLEELNQQYKNNEISRLELKTSVEDLIDQYGLEDDAANRLRNSYILLGEEIDELRKKRADEARASAETEKNAAEKTVKATAKNTHGWQAGNDYVLAFQHGMSYLDEPDALINLFEQQGFNYNLFNNLEKTIDFSAQSITDLYHTLVNIRQTAQASINQDILDESEVYKNLIKWLGEMEESVKKYEQSLAELQQYQSVITGLKIFNSDDINNANQYIQKRQQLIEAIKAEQNIDTENATALADAYIRENYRTLYTEFNDYSTIVDKFKDKFGEVGKENQKTINEIVKQMSELDPDHMGKLMDIVRLHPQVINSWDQLLAIVKQVMGLASSNVTIDSSLQDATAQYNKYQSVEDTIRSGKTISPETYKQLDPRLQSFFKMAIDGTYKMVGVAKEFYAAVDDLKLQPFENRIESINQELEHWNDIKENNSLNKFDQNIIDSAWTESLNRSQVYDFPPELQNYSEQIKNATEQAQQQLEYLKQVAIPGSELAEILIPAWQTALNQGLTEDLAQVLAQAVQDNQYEDKTAALQDDKYLTGLTMASSAQSIQELKELRDIIGDQAFNQAAINLDNALDTKNLDPEELEEYSKYLQRVADNVEILDDELDDHDDAAKDVAKSIMKMNDGLEILSNNWENWSDVLANSTEESEEYHKAMDGTREAIANLLDVSEEYVRDTFIEQHLDDITDAANGSETAINELKTALLEDIVAKIVLDNHIPDEGEQLKADIAALQAAIPSDLKVGTKLETKSFLDAANNLIKNSKLTVDQVNAIFDDLGFETHFKTTKKKVKQTVPKIVTYTKAEDLGEFDGRKLTRTETVSYQNGSSTFYGQMDVPAMSTNDDIPAIDFVTTKADSSFSDFSSINTGGNTGSSGGRSSGGSSKSPSLDTSKKDTKNPAKDTRDIYHDINIELKQIEREIDRVQDKQDRLYGKELLDNLNKQQELLDKHNDTLKEKQKLQEWDLQNQREELENLDVTFDAYGNISNYMDILGQKQAAVNAKTKEYNDLVAQYNAETDKDTKKQIADQMDAVNKQLKAAEDDYKNLQDKIKSYDGLREDMEDLVDQVEEETQKQIEIEIEKFRMELEIRLDMGEAERDWNKFRREVLEHTDLLKDSDFDKIYSDAQLSSRDLTSYFNVGDGVGSIETLMNQLMNTRNELEAINETGTSAIYGDNKAQAMEDLQNDLDELMNQMEDVEGLIDDIDKAYFDTIDDVDKNFDKQIEDYEFVGDLIEHDIDLLTLLYGEQNYNAMEKYYNTLQENNLKQLDSLKQQRDFWKQQWDEAVARGDSQAAEEFEKNYKETFKKLNSAIEESAKNLQTAYENAINGIFDALDKQISGGMGTDYANMEWELMQKNANEYLDTINSAFAIQDTQRKYQQAIDNTQNIKDQQRLKELMDEQVGALRDKERISEYDVQRAEKLLQVEQARIALEDARAAKTTMRLKRDSQGNYTYEYKADDDAIGDAAGQLAAAQQDLYNFDKEAYQANLKDMLAAWQDFQNQYKKILLDTSLSEEDRIAQLALLREQYGEYINNKTEENYAIRMNYTDSFYDSLMQMYAANADNYAWMTDQEKASLIGNLEQSKEAYKDSLAIQLEDFIAYREQYDAIINSDLTEEEKDQAIKNLKIENHQLELQDFENYRNSYDAILNNDTTEEQKLALINDLQKGYTEEQLIRAQDYRKKYDEIMSNKQLTAEQKEAAIAKLRSQYNQQELKTLDDYKLKYDKIAKGEELTAEQKEILIAGLKSKYTDAQVKTLEGYRIKYNKIANDETIDAKKKEEAIAKLQSDYSGKREGFLKSAFGVAAGLYTNNEKQYKTMLDNESDLLTKQFLPTWNGSIQKMSNTFSGKGGFLPTAQKAFTDIAKETTNYTNSLDEMAKAAGTDFGKIKSGTNEAAKELSNLITKNKTLIDNMGTELDSIQKLDTAARNLKDAYNGVYEQAKNAAKAIQDVIKAEQLDAAQKAAEQAKKDAQAASKPTTKPATTPSTNTTSTTTSAPKITTPSLTVGSAVKLKNNALLADNSYTTPSVAANSWAKNTTLYIQQAFSDGRKAPYHVGTTKGGINDSSTWVGWVDKKQLQGFKSGGYTGKWNDDMEGKLALLHQKELVLNQEDTKNLLNTVTILRTITSSLGGVALSRLNNIKSNFINDLIDKNNLQQDVHIEANFPNVNSKREIEEAFDNLINEAAQRSNNRDR